MSIHRPTSLTTPAPPPSPAPIARPRFDIFVYPQTVVPSISPDIFPQAIPTPLHRTTQRDSLPETRLRPPKRNRHFTSPPPTKHFATGSIVAPTSAPHCAVELADVHTANLNGFTPLSSRNCHGCLGLIGLGRDIFICIITNSQEVATVKPGEHVSRITGVEFCMLNLEYLGVSDRS